MKLKPLPNPIAYIEIERKTGRIRFVSRKEVTDHAMTERPRRVFSAIYTEDQVHQIQQDVVTVYNEVYADVATLCDVLVEESYQAVTNQ
jgi:hypothetical protein